MSSRAELDETFGRFVALSQVSLTRTAWYLTGDTDLAADLVQEAYVKVYVAWSRVRDDGALAYARRVVVNANTDRLRRRHGETSLPDGRDVVDPRDATAGVDEQDRFARWLAILPRRQRQAVVLRYLQDLSEAEAAEILGISRGAVSSNASRGLATLRAHAAQFEMEAVA